LHPLSWYLELQANYYFSLHDIVLYYYGISNNLILDNLDSKLNNQVAILICGHGSRNKLAITEFEELTKFKNTINERFSNPEIKDQLFRVARNPAIKFSFNERFQEPLDILINNDKSVAGFKKVLNIIFNLSFEDIEGFNDFKKDVLDLGRSNFYKNFWNQDKNYEKYLNMLGD